MGKNHMKNLIPIVGLDFLDATRTRIFCFQLCSRTAGKLESVALVNLRGDAPPEVATTRALSHRAKAIVRLARIYRNRSIPFSTHEN